MTFSRVKYLLSAAIVGLFAQALCGSAAPVRGEAFRTADSLIVNDTAAARAPEGRLTDPAPSRSQRRNARRNLREEERRRDEFNALPQEVRDSIAGAQLDSLVARKADSLADDDTLRRDTVGRLSPAQPFLDDPITGQNADSLVYDVRNKMVYIYNQGDVTYQNSNLKADYMQIDMDSKLIYAYGKPDTLDGRPVVTKPEFTEGSASYRMDTITYNLSSKKAKIKGVATQQGDGWLVGGSVKKMADNTINIQHGKYTTCDHTDHPHFYLAMTKAKVIPGKKVVSGPAYLVMEDVPIYFLGIPEGFFPINLGPKSGFLMPTYGEEYTKGFFLRNFGYYFTMGDYADLALRGGFYTLGSWEASAASRYVKRYKYSGNLDLQYSNVKVGDKGDADYIKQNNFQIKWTHSQDPKANPGSTFSASVNFATSGYSRYSATNLGDMLATQTNSSISYSKNWAGTPFSLSANMAVSQNSRDKTLSVTLPTVVFNVSRIHPFKRKERQGKERWYEKISLQYTGKLTNSVTTTENKIFTKETLDNMRNGIEHTLPVSAQFNLFNYINISPQANYSEKWFFKRTMLDWNPMTNQTDTTRQHGFYRLYNYNFSVSAGTTVYGMYDFTKKNRNRKLQAIRHTITPDVSFSYAPDFGHQKYGYYRSRQIDSTGRFATYSPYAGNAYSVPSSGRSMQLGFSLKQNLEMKVLSKRDTSGVKKIKLIDELRISGSYNFLADSMGLSNISVGLRTTLFKNFGLNLSATLDPYRLTPQGQHINKIRLPGRVISTGWSFGPLAARPERHHQHPARVPESLLRPLRHDGPRPAAPIHVAGLLRLLAAVELRIQLFGQLLEFALQQRHDGLSAQRLADHRLQRLAHHHRQDRHHLQRRLRHPEQQAHHLADNYHARPPLLADVVLVDSVRPLPQLEFQHRRESCVALRPQVRQVAVDVRQHVLRQTKR